MCEHFYAYETTNGMKYCKACREVVTDRCDFCQRWRAPGKTIVLMSRNGRRRTACFACFKRYAEAKTG